MNEKRDEVCWPGRYWVEGQHMNGHWYPVAVLGLMIDEKHQYPEKAEEVIDQAMDRTHGNAEVVLANVALRARCDVPAKAGADGKSRYSIFYVDERQHESMDQPICECGRPIDWARALRVLCAKCTADMEKGPEEGEELDDFEGELDPEIVEALQEG